MKNLSYIAIPAIAVLAFAAQFADFASISGIQALKKDKEHIDKRVEELKDEKIKLAANILRIQADQKTWAEQEAIYLTRIDAKKGILQRLDDAEGKLQKVNGDIDTANETLKKLNRDIARKTTLAAGIDDLEIKIAGLKDAKKDLNKNIGDLNEDIWELTSNRTGLLEQQKDLIQSIARLEPIHTEYQEEEKNLQTLQDAVKGEEAKFDRIKNNTNNKQIEFDGLKEGVEKLKDETASLEAKKIELERIKAAIKEEQAKIIAVSNLDADIEEKRSEVGRLNGELTRQASSLEVRKIELEKITADIVEEKAKITAIANLDADIEEKRIKVGRLNGELTRQASSLEVRKIELEKITADIEDEKAKITAVANLDAVIAKRRIDVNRLNGEIISLTATLESTKIERNRIKADLEALRKEKEREEQKQPGNNPADPDGEGAGSSSEGGN